MAKTLLLTFEKLSDLANRVEFFSTMNEHQRVKVLKQLEGEVLAYERAETIIEEGADDCEMYIILSGLVTVQKGEEEFTAVGALREGDFFGEVSFIMKSKRMATVVANEETILLRLSQEKFTSLELAIQMIIKDKVLRKLILRLNTMNQYVLKLRNR